MFPDTTVTEETHTPPPDEPQGLHGGDGGLEETEERIIEDEEVKAPVQLKTEFLRALKDKDLQLASKLCQIILIYEPEHPEASEFLPLIRDRLLEEQEAEHRCEDDEDSDEDGDDDSDSHEDSRASSSSSLSDDDDDVDDEDDERTTSSKTTGSIQVRL
ncbi:glutamate-rich protein 2 [Salarias fasciatus]|uniref:glutamate-rich protein 2 n=1 Tax=Salarias fasciatus TaxID=181472 RepID=UPI001176F7A6|nr:glutamate-rich protein 2-like [Salarias fasciatus]